MDYIEAETLISRYFSGDIITFLKHPKSLCLVHIAKGGTFLKHVNWPREWGGGEA